MGIFSKTKKVPDKKLRINKSAQKEITRIAEFTFDKGFEMKPGQVVQWSRRSGSSYYFDEYGEWDVEKMKLLMGEKGMPRISNPFEGGYNRRLDDARANFALQVLQKKHRVMIEMEQGLGDYITFRTRGIADARTFRISMTEVVGTPDLSMFVDKIERGLGLSDKTVRLTSEDKNKSATESWAEKWAKENDGLGTVK